MDLRSMIIERIFFALTDEDLEQFFALKPSEVTDLSDIDLLEMYEEVMGIGV